MPFSRFPRPQYGQMWTWEGILPPFMLLCPQAPRDGAWWVIRLERTADPYAMFGLYADRDPIAGYTFIEGPTE